jgi:methionyl-tRNA formyltransferase
VEEGNLKILFAGTPQIAVPSLHAIASRFRVVAVLTNPDKPGARGRDLVPTPVKQAALALGLPVLQPERLLGRAREEVASYRPDVLVSFAYGRMFGPKFLALFEKGAVNIHPSKLPICRGCAPIQNTILRGDRETAVSIQRIADQMDCGDLYYVDRFNLDGTETTPSLTDIVSARAAKDIVQVLHGIETGSLVPVPQQGEPTYTRMVCKEDGVIDWNSEARQIHAKVRALLPWPKATTTFGGVPLLITGVFGSYSEAGADPVPDNVVAGTVVGMRKGKGIAVACADGLLWVTRLQLAARKEMDWQAFLNGNPAFIGAVLGG